MRTVTNQYRTAHTPPILGVGSEKAETIIAAGATALVGLVQIQWMRDSCRTLVARLYGYGSHGLFPSRTQHELKTPRPLI